MAPAVRIFSYAKRGKQTDFVVQLTQYVLKRYYESGRVQQMKKKVLLVVIIFLVCTAFIKVWDITNKYEVDLFEYFAYSKELSQNEKRFLENSVIHYGIDMDDAPFAFTEIESELNTGLLVDYFNQLSVILENNFQPVPYESYHLAVKLKEG